jgi:predicted nucleic acid-binding protein
MGRIKRSIIAVFDAGPIIHLDELASLDLLSDFKENILPDAVWREVHVYRPTALTEPHINLIHLTEPGLPGGKLRTMCRLFSLDAGETEALAVMASNPTAVFFTDDSAARLVAEQMGYKVHGTIGILIRSVRRGQRKAEDVLRTLAEIPLKSTLYVKPSLLEEVKARVRASFELEN